MIEILGLVHDCSRANDLAVVVDEDVTHDGEHPSLEVYIVHILVLVVESLQSSVLKKIVSIVTVGSEDIRKIQ